MLEREKAATKRCLRIILSLVFIGLGMLCFIARQNVIAFIGGWVLIAGALILMFSRF